ncbi:hypothetical protein KIKIMORA_01980 [Brevundimonas phage vB_BpoS-Kikimora]|uniref:Uncharacterized protein n=1 Tax=Brevundimonas phage vB_BpoS-Kikimora TaxID=2948601 RepID=A0A9E7MRZ1_9CAUD|nr:hypothetical protein KIKIMORA_01980 [Brevundimonas phage vB_BpoS-Kikimora]
MSDETISRLWTVELSAREETALLEAFGHGGGAVRRALLKGIDAVNEDREARKKYGDAVRMRVDIPAADVRLMRIAIRTVVDQGHAFIRTLEEQLKKRPEANDNTFTLTLRGYLDIERAKVAEFQTLLDRLPPLGA